MSALMRQYRRYSCQRSESSRHRCDRPVHQLPWRESVLDKPDALAIIDDDLRLAGCQCCDSIVVRVALSKSQRDSVLNRGLAGGTRDVLHVPIGMSERESEQSGLNAIVVEGSCIVSRVVKPGGCDHRGRCHISLDSLS